MISREIYLPIDISLYVDYPQIIMKKLPYIMVFFLFTLLGCQFLPNFPSEEENLFLIDNFFQKEGKFYCIPINISNGPSSEFLVFSQDSNCIYLLDSNFTTLKTLSIKGIPVFDGIRNIKTFPVDSFGHTGAYFLDKSEKLYYLRNETGFEVIDLAKISHQLDRSISVVKTSFMSRYGLTLFLVTENKDSVSYYLYSLKPFELKERFLDSGRPLQFYSEGNKYYSLVKDENYKVFSFNNGIFQSETPIPKKIERFCVPEDSKNGMVICLTDVSENTKEVWEVSTVDSISSRIVGFPGEKVSYFACYGGSKQLLIAVDDTLMYTVAHKSLKKITFLPIDTIFVFHGLLGWDESTMCTLSKDKKATIYDASIRPISSIHNLKSLYEFKKGEISGLVINRSNGFTISYLNLNILSVKRILFIMLLVVLIISGLLVIVWLFYKLRFQLSLHNKLLASSENMIIVTDNWGLVVFMNDKIKSFLSSVISSQIHYKKVCLRHILENSPFEKLLRLFEKAKSSKEEIEDVLEVSINQKHHTLVTNVSPMKGTRNSVVGYVINVEDVSDIIENKRMLAWAVMARNITHEIRNPLSSIVLAARGLEKRLSNESKIDECEYEKYLDVIKAELGRINYLITTLLKLYMDKKVKPGFEDINKLVKDLLESIKTKIPKEVKLSLELQEDMPYVVADKDLAMLAIINIVNNAIDSTGSRGSIKISTYLDSKFAILEIRDNGKGIDKSSLSKVKELGYTTKETGFGLGLTIADEILEKFGGQLLIESEKHTGTTVYLEFRIRGE